jgi:hypothetical protein
MPSLDDLPPADWALIEAAVFAPSKGRSWTLMLGPTDLPHPSLPQSAVARGRRLQGGLCLTVLCADASGPTAVTEPLRGMLAPMVAAGISYGVKAQVLAVLGKVSSGRQALAPLSVGKILRRLGLAGASQGVDLRLVATGALP